MKRNATGAILVRLVALCVGPTGLSLSGSRLIASLTTSDAVELGERDRKGGRTTGRGVGQESPYLG